MIETAQSLQFAWFFGQTPDITADKAMKDLLGLDADQMQTNRVPSPQAPFLSSAVRSEGAREFRLDVSPGRADLFIKPAPDSAQPTRDMPLVNVSAAAQDVFERFKKGNVNCFGGVYRVAVVAPYLVHCSSLEEAQKIFFERVGIARFEGPVSDLAFSFNKRKISSVHGISLNRIMNYSVSQFQNIRFNVGPNNEGNNRVIATNYAFGMNVDINSVPVEGTIPTGSLLTLFEEIFDEMEGATKLKSPQELI